MNVTLKKSIRRLLHRMGWELHRYRASSDSQALLADLLHRRRVDVVFDIGANTGQFASELRYAGYRGNIVSCEPLKQAHRALEAKALADDQWIVVPRCAIGASAGTVEMNVSENSVSSSVLPMLESHRAAAPNSYVVGQETVPMQTLDQVSRVHASGFKRAFLKIDTQGYEWAVLNGAELTLQNVVAMTVETSLVPLYEGQKLWLEMIDRITRAGFVVWDIQPAFASPDGGRLLQADIVFARL